MKNNLTCPACSTPMSVQNFGSVKVDVCEQGCGRIWFDAGELQLVNHHKKGLGPTLAAAAEVGLPTLQEELQLACPHCAEAMDQMEYKLQTTVTIDFCPNCAGVLLDPGELKEIRKRKLTDEEFRKTRRRFRKRTSRRRAAQKTAEQNTVIALMVVIG